MPHPQTRPSRPTHPTPAPRRTLARSLSAALLAALALALARPAPAAAQACPAPCGQVRVSGAALADGAGPWRMRGVQFFLPQYGINAKTFRDDNYAAAAADGSLDLWLGRASGYLQANLLRIFVDMPSRASDGSLSVPTSSATLRDFAARAAARGMRLGLVLHNSASWTMTADRAAWVDSTLADFASAGELGRIAYVSADNEINNHCGNGGADCFDAGPSHDAQAYLDGAVGWTAQLRAAVKARAPQVLVTVGITTERADADGTRAAFDLFKRATDGRRLADLSDFLSPHNYSGGAPGVIADIRVGAGYQGAVVLEEFGFPTDPAPVSLLWTEGPFSCRLNPWSAECLDTAPSFVARSLVSIANDGYAGGVAWMLADMREKNVPDACAGGAPFDLWTGLFAIGGAYCDGGTSSRASGQPKATGFLVCWAYGGDIGRCDDPLRPLFRTALPSVAR